MARFIRSAIVEVGASTAFFPLREDFRCSCATALQHLLEDAKTTSTCSRESAWNAEACSNRSSKVCIETNAKAAHFACNAHSLKFALAEVLRGRFLPKVVCATVGPCVASEKSHRSSAHSLTLIPFRRKPSDPSLCSTCRLWREMCCFCRNRF